MSIVKFGKDAFKTTLGIPQQVANLLVRQGSRRAANMQNPPVNGSKIDYGALNADTEAAAPQVQQQPGMGRKVLTSFLDYAKSPEGKQSLIDLVSLAVASGQSDPYVSGAIATGVQERIKQRPILEQQRLEREQAAKDRELDKKLKDALLRQRKTEADKNAADTKPELNENPPHTPTLTEDEYNNLPKILRPYKYKAENEGMETQYGISRKGLEKVDELEQGARKELRQSRDDSESMNRNVNRLLNSEKEFKSVIGTFKTGIFNLPKGEFKEFFKLLTPEEISFRETLDTISSDKFLSVLKNTRSPKTGATGFGQLTEREFDLLKKAFTSLRETQDPKTFESNLIFVRDTLKRSRDRAERDYKSLYRDLPTYQQLPVYNDSSLPTSSQLERKTDTTQTVVEISTEELLKRRGYNQ